MKKLSLFKNAYALLVGVGADLPITVKDATAIHGVLIEPKRAAYPKEQVTLLTETTATRNSILDAFDHLIAQVNQNPDATVFVYYSGHGGRIERLSQPSEYFLVPHGYDPARRADTTISGQEFTEKIEAIRARKLVVLLDCCHAAGVPALKAPNENFVKTPIPPELLAALDSGSGRVVIASSHEHEYSYTGTPYSVFTTCLLEALAGKAAVNKDGYSRILDTLIYLFKHVPEKAPGAQHPFVKKVLDLGDNFPLCYYAGGSKHLPGEPPSPGPAPSSGELTSMRRRRLQQRQDILESELQVREEKLKRFRKVLPIEVDEAVKFGLERRILDEEAAIARLYDELEEIERTLQLKNA
ncbi:MAG: caspase family protein [bacterium]|nr:caspase family protein [bacterium]